MRGAGKRWAEGWAHAFLVVIATLIWPPLFLAWVAGMLVFLGWSRWYSLSGGWGYGTWTTAWHSAKQRGMQHLRGYWAFSSSWLHEEGNREGSQDGGFVNEAGEDVVIGEISPNPLDSDFRRG